MKLFEGLISKVKSIGEEKKEEKKEEKPEFSLANSIPCTEQDPPKAKLTDAELSLNPGTRYLTHLSTDKPIYREGDKVYIKGVVLHGLHRRPYGSVYDKENIGNGLVYRMIDRAATLEIISPSGDKVFEALLKNGDRSVVSAFWNIPQGQPGGDYKARISWKYANFPPAEREFNIRAFRNARVKSQIKFQRKGYGAGEEAVATLNVKRAEGDVPLGAKVSASVRVDGKEVSTQELTLEDPNGNLTIRFKLPDSITTGEGTLSCRIQDGGSVETASQTIPILLQKMDVRVYPEGGELVEGILNHFYIEAFTKNGDPADIEAKIIEKGSEKEVGDADTVHEGRGKSSFTPIHNKEYYLKVVKPSGIINTIPLPKSVSKGVSLSSCKETFKFDEDVEILLSSNKSHKFKVNLYRVDVQLDSKTIEIEAETPQKLNLSSGGVCGVLRVTVYLDKTPIAERIVFKHPEKKLAIELIPNEKGHSPGNNASFRVKTSDEKGNPVEAYVGLVVTDDTVLEMVEKRKQVPRLPEMALLENEVNHLHDCQFYFDPNESKSNQAIDLLLGTQGWRRFVFENEESAQKLEEAKRQRLLIRKDEVPRPVPVEDEILFRHKLKKKEGGMREKDKEMRMDDKFDLKPLKNQARVEKIEAKEEKKEVKEEEKQVKEKQRDKEEPVAKKEQEKNRRDDLDVENLVMEDMKIEMRAEGFGKEKKKKMMNRKDMKPKIPKEVGQSIVREFAFQPKANRQVGERSNFTETLYWNACVKTSKEGTFDFSFGLNDSVTSFKVWADGFTADGVVGSHSVLFDSKEPFYLEPKLPLEVTEGDVIRVPVSLVNSLQEGVDGSIDVQLNGNGLKSSDSSPLSFHLETMERARKCLDFTVNRARGKTSVTIEGKTPQLSDKVTRSVSVVPQGFPFQLNGSGMIEPDTRLTHKFNVPQSFIKDTMQVSLKLYCTPDGNLSEAIKSLNRKPSGCFEQTSTTTYPLVMAIIYLESHKDSDPELIASCRANLTSGYERLKGYECKSGGFEWFGGDPGHEALTAYGIMQFTEMQHVISVDKEMIQRTVKWLNGRRKKQGGFERNSRALDNFGGAPQEHTDAYITWALTEAGEKTSDDVDFVIKNCAEKKQDAYLWALTAICLYKLNRREEATKWSRKIAELIKEDGSVADEETSITRSGGQSLVVEATALSLLAWLNDEDSFRALSNKASEYLTSKCQNGSFGSTQATLLALKAIIEFDKKRATPKAEGVLVATLNGNEEIRIVLNEESKGTIEGRDFGDKFVEGENVLQLEMLKGCKLPYSINLDFFSLSGDSDDKCQVKLSTKLNDQVVKEGKSTEVKVNLENVSTSSLPMTIAIIGIPGGLEPRIDKLKEMVKEGVIDFYEILGRRVALYWRFIPPKEKKELLIDVVAAVPGTYTGPASSSYLYYTDELVCWTPGLKVEIVE
eukprot:TRINITY_DN2019_c3_g3_i1.p1 TRINITY_DN2019_c3_g3~~TRINITY_DN2019_c3_g3_i1.p1  ORF type:complete len:1433 (-),score=577.93 TRINITY_DN2019_c3_g3_i1:70-4368(-)